MLFNRIPWLDEVDVPSHQFGESILRFCLGIATEEITIEYHCQGIVPGQRRSGHEHWDESP